jgi:DNA-binding transcriptional MerR regulator
MPADDLTPGQVAELLQVDASTLRRWARAWKSNLSEQGQAKRRRYTQADLATFARGQAMLRAGRSPVEVAALLAVEPNAPANVPAVALVSVPALAVELQAAQEGLRAMQGALDGVRKVQAEQAGEIAQLRAELAAWRALPWWRRVFGRK